MFDTSEISSNIQGRLSKLEKEHRCFDLGLYFCIIMIFVIILSITAMAVVLSVFWPDSEFSKNLASPERSVTHSAELPELIQCYEVYEGERKNYRLMWGPDVVSVARVYIRDYARRDLLYPGIFVTNHDATESNGLKPFKGLHVVENKGMWYCPKADRRTFLSNGYASR